MRLYCVISIFVILLSMTSAVWGKHNGRRHKQKDSQNKHLQLFNVKHLSHHKNHKKANAHDLLQFKGHHGPIGFKCRGVKFIVNRNLHLKKESTDAMRRHMRLKHVKHVKHAKKVLHKFVRGKKRFRLPKEAKLFEDKDGNLVTYIEDCVSSEHAEKKNFFEGEKELFIAPAFDEKKIHQGQDSSENSVKPEHTSENDISEEGILPASEDSLFQTVSDSTEILKESAQREGTAQYLNDQHDKQVPSNFASIFQPAKLENPIPKKAEEGSEMQSFFSSTGLTTIPPLPSSDVVTPVSNQPVNSPLPQHDNDFPMAASANSVDAEYVTNPAPLGQVYIQGGNDERITAPIRTHGYTSVLRDPEITHAKFTGNAGGQGFAHSIKEAFNKLGNAEEQELESYTNNGLNVPQTLGEEMSMENAEANYEKTFENVYGKSNSIGLQKGAAYLPEKQQ